MGAREACLCTTYVIAIIFKTVCVGFRTFVYLVRASVKLMSSSFSSLPRQRPDSGTSVSSHRRLLRNRLSLAVLAYFLLSSKCASKVRVFKRAKGASTSRSALIARGSGDPCRPRPRLSVLVWWRCWGAYCPSRRGALLCGCGPMRARGEARWSAAQLVGEPC